MYKKLFCLLASSVLGLSLSASEESSGIKIMYNNSNGAKITEISHLHSADKKTGYIYEQFTKNSNSGTVNCITEKRTGIPTKFLIFTRIPNKSQRTICNDNLSDLGEFNALNACLEKSLFLDIFLACLKKHHESTASEAAEQSETTEASEAAE